jgi:predicted esterase
MRTDNLQAGLVKAVLFVGLLVAAVACGDDDSQPGPVGPVARFSLTPMDFFAQPWPSDLRITSDGRLDLTGFPEGELLVQNLLEAAAQECTGFAVGGAVYFSFSAEVDPASLPADGAETLDAAASVYVVNVDPASSEYGRRVPLWVKTAARASRYISANWVGLLPFPGHPLIPGTTYAAVVTTGVRTVDGEPFAADADFAALLGDDDRPEVVHARAVFAPLLDYLAEGSSDPVDLAAATVFTTQEVTGVVRRAREVVRSLPAPTLDNLVLVSQSSHYDLYEGTYNAPIFQMGEAPYRQEGGAIEVDAQGDPIVQRTEALRVAISIPVEDPMPAGGWPVALYRHGTGGDYMTFTDNGTASRLANATDVHYDLIGRVAVVSIDGVVHGPRANGSTTSPEELFYNFQNPMAGRDNSRQEAIDNFGLVRLAEVVNVAAAPETGAPIRFDSSRIYFFGHSQGGITGALFVPFEPLVQAAVLSGTGAHLLLTLLRKDSEFPISTLLEIALNDDDYETLDDFHPALNIVQTFLEPADPLAYARAYIREPPGDMPPRSVLLTYGINDSYTPNLTTEVLATAAGFAPAGEIITDYAAMELMGSVTPLSVPVCDNYDGATGVSTAVVVQYQPASNRDGHFVVFDHLTAKRQSAGFLASHAAGGCATLVE